MQTHYLGAEEVTAYSRDLASRLEHLGSQFPLQWFGLGLSGRKIIDGLLDLLPPEWVGKIQIGIANYDRAKSEINFSEVTVFEDLKLGNRPILVLDAAVHSGKESILI